MAITRIKVSNFKSFDDLQVDLGNFNILIGANASGKSNFIQILRFLKNIAESGLDNAISMLGGAEFLQNIGISPSKNTVIEIDSTSGSSTFFQNGIQLNPGYATYKIEFKVEGDKIKTDENACVKGSFSQIKVKDGAIHNKKELGSGGLRYSNSNGQVSVDVDIPENISVKNEDFGLYHIAESMREHKLLNKSLLHEEPFCSSFFGTMFSDTAIYDFDPKLPKKAVPIAGKVELEEDGNNLALVLKKILSDKDNKRKFSNLIKDLLPAIEDIGVEGFADNRLIFSLEEKYFKGQKLPASLISDGTVNLTAMIIALYFQKTPLAIIEEPERNIHPYLISRVVEMMKDASEHKQIIVTTHNPEIVKHADLDDILLVSRNEKGVSNISKPRDNKAVRTFLQNELGIEELYVQNLLGD